MKPPVWSTRVRLQSEWTGLPHAYRAAVFYSLAGWMLMIPAFLIAFARLSGAGPIVLILEGVYFVSQVISSTTLGLPKMGRATLPEPFILRLARYATAVQFVTMGIFLIFFAFHHKVVF